MSERDEAPTWRITLLAPSDPNDVLTSAAVRWLNDAYGPGRAARARVWAHLEQAVSQALREQAATQGPDAALERSVLSNRPASAGR